MKNLVFIHGFASGGYIFGPLIDALPAEYSVVNLSLPGHEQKPNMEADIDLWCEHYIPYIPHGATIIAWSLGGLLALKLADKLPFKQLILLATTPQFVRTHEWQYGIHYQNFISFSDNVQVDKEKALTRFMAMQGVDKHTLKTLKAQISINLPSSKGMIHALKVLYECSVIEQYLRHKDKITMILGERDYIVPMQLREWLDEWGITTHVLPSGHMPFFHEEFNLEHYLIK